MTQIAADRYLDSTRITQCLLVCLMVALQLATACLRCSDSLLPFRLLMTDLGSNTVRHVTYLLFPKNTNAPTNGSTGMLFGSKFGFEIIVQYCCSLMATATISGPVIEF
jgi:hypothetical protein